jgi:hypothetical protein
VPAFDDYLDGLAPEQRDALELAKGTIRFAPERPVPDDVLTDLVAARRREIAG